MQFCKDSIVWSLSYRYNLFIVYSKSYPSGQFQSVDDHLAFLEDYHVIPQFITKEKAVTNFMDIVSRYDHGGLIETANYMKYTIYYWIIYSYEGFVEGIGKLALIVFSNPSLAQMYSSISMKIAMFIEIWNLGDEAILTIHQQERKLNNQS